MTKVHADKIYFYVIKHIKTDWVYLSALSTQALERCILTEFSD